MHVTVPTQTLRDTLDLAARVSTRHVTLPVLQCVLLDVRDGKCSVRATNLEVGIETVIAADVHTDGIVAVPAATLLQTVGLHSGEHIDIKADNGTLVVSGSGASAKIKAIPHDDFPSIPSVDGAGQQLNGPLFSLGIRTTAFAASQSSIKPELGSVYVYQKKEHTLSFVATDSFRLMEKTVSQKSVILDASMLIPHRNALELARVCDTVATNPTLRFDENLCSLTFEDGTRITSRLTSGSFPDYEGIIPKEYALETTVLREDLIHAFKKSGIFLNKFFQVKLLVETNSITVEADNSDVGTATESVRAQSSGEPLTLSFNQRYIADALPHFTDESIILRFAGVGRPMVITGANDVSIRYLVMPMNK